MNVEDVIAKVLARYESDLLYEIIERCSKKNDVGEITDISIDAIEDLVEILSDCNHERGDELLYSFEKYKKNKIITALRYLCKLYKRVDNCQGIISGDVSDENIERNIQSGVYKSEFRRWLIESEGKSKATANNYICGFNFAQKHYNLCSHSNLNFYDTKDICVLQPIFDKYINGDYSQIGKKYSGAVRASLEAYSRFLQQSINGCEDPVKRFVPRKSRYASGKTRQAYKLAQKFILLGLPVPDSLKELYESSDNSNSSEQPNPYYKKALHKISGWAQSPWQQNHKLIKSYFKAYHMFEEPPTKKMLQQISGDASNQEFYVRDFVGTYNSLRADGVRTNGKVFEDDGERVQIWEEIKDELLKYEKYFYNPEDK